jgi:hypothetical protein
VVGVDQIVDESGVVPKKYPPGLRSDIIVFFQTPPRKPKSLYTKLK